MEYLKVEGTFPYVIRIGMSDNVFTNVTMGELQTWAEKTLGKLDETWSFDLDTTKWVMDFRFLDKKGAMAFKLKWM